MEAFGANKAGTSGVDGMVGSRRGLPNMYREALSSVDQVAWLGTSSSAPLVCKVQRWEWVMRPVRQTTRKRDRPRRYAGSFAEVFEYPVGRMDREGSHVAVS